MCGRFTASFEFREIKLLFNLQGDLPLVMRRYNIAPSQEVPVIFDGLQARQWLDPRLSMRAADIAAVLAPFPSELMEAHDVSPLVNKPKNETPDCITPVADQQFRLI